MAVPLEPARVHPQASQQVNGAAQEKTGQSSNGAPKKPRPKRPNFHEIHAKPLPVDVYPLPTFIPHNPISIVRIAISLLLHSIWPPRSHQVIHKAYYSPETQSLHVTDSSSVRALWEQGFWGKGSLSRSEPQWFVAEKRKRGAEAAKTSAEVTFSRREERRQFKLERAKAQREAIEQQLRSEGKLDADGSIEELVEDGLVSESPKGTIYTPDAGDIVTVIGDSIVAEVGKSLHHGSASIWDIEDAEVGAEVGTEAAIKDLEHLQLTPEEAFFLTYVLGALDVVGNGDLEVDETLGPYPAWYLMRLYCTHVLISDPSHDIAEKIHCLRAAYKTLKDPHGTHLTIFDIPFIEPDNPFILNYIVFHHFRSLGWVVRPGIKFAVDYLLYLRGPAFTHAEFAIMIIPSYSHPYWSEKSKREADDTRRGKDWWWLHRINRVQTQVMKTLILVYVEVPPPWDNVSAGGDLELDVGSVLKKYTVREFILRRWSPSRNRD